MPARRSAAAANAAADAMTALLNGGVLRIYDGAQPANVATAVGTQVVLAELTLGNPAFAAASGGVATANAITGDTSANATGTATWFRVFASGGTVPHMDGSAGASGSGAEMILNSTAISAGAAVNITSWTVSEGLG